MNTGPILTVFGGGLFFKDQKLTWEIIAKVLVAFIGVLLIVLGDTQETEDVLTIPQYVSQEFGNVQTGSEGAK